MREYNLMPVPIGKGFMLFPDTTGYSIYYKVITHAKHREERFEID